MRKLTIIYLIFITFSCCYLTAQGKTDQKAEKTGKKTGKQIPYKQEAGERYAALKQIRANYIKIFKLDKKFKNRWKNLDMRFKKAEEFYNQGDYYTSLERFEKIITDLKYLADNRENIKDEVPQKKPKPRKKDPCSKDAEIFRAAYMSAQNKNIPRAIELFCKITKSKCLPEYDREYAEKFISEKKESVLENLDKLKQAQSSEEKSRLVSAAAEIIKGFKKCDPQWAAQFEKLVARYDYVSKIESKPGIQPGAKPVEKIKEKTEYTPPETEKKEYVEIERSSAARVGSPYFLALDVWQSAWLADFNEKGLRPLLDYLRKNRIRNINLNPGLPMGPKFNQDSYKKFKPLVDAFYDSGVQEINFLYAELDYPIEHFAEFLKKHPELGIDTIVDDSEFTDFYKDRFDRNLRAVHRWGLKYSAFSTLEVVGNSGVSDETRFWMLRNVDYPILMSYFGCTLENQKKVLTKYLQYADNLGKRRTVSIAILLGGKSVGREVSCEKLLNESALQRFLWDLDAWARKNHPSYRGIIIETNLRQPQYNIHLNHR